MEPRDETPVPIPSPAPKPTGLGFWGAVYHFIAPFADSLAGFCSGPEYDRATKIGLSTGTVAGFFAALLQGWSPYLQESVGPCFAPLVGMIVSAVVTHFGVRGKVHDSTDSAGKRVPSSVVKGRRPPTDPDDGPGVRMADQRAA